MAAAGLPVGAQGRPVAVHEAAVGDTPMEIAEAQEILVARGHDLGHFGSNGDGVDGRQGKRTTAAIKDFQRHHGIEATGELDAATTAALREERDQGQQRQAPFVQPREPVQGKRSLEDAMHKAAAIGFDGPENVTPLEVGAALVAAGFSLGEVEKFGKELTQRHPGVASTTDLSGLPAEAIRQELNANNGVTLHGQHVSPSQALGIIGSATGKGGIEDQQAAAVIRAMRDDMEKEQSHDRAGAQSRDEGLFAGIDDGLLGTAAKGLRLSGAAVTHHGGGAVTPRQIGGALRVAGDVLGL